MVALVLSAWNYCRKRVLRQFQPPRPSSFPPSSFWNAPPHDVASHGNSANDEFFVATSDELKDSTGKFYVSRRVQAPPPPAQDEEACGRLWKVLEDLSGFSYA